MAVVPDLVIKLENYVLHDVAKEHDDKNSISDWPAYMDKF